MLLLCWCPLLLSGVRDVVFGRHDVVLYLVLIMLQPLWKKSHLLPSYILWCLPAGQEWEWGSNRPRTSTAEHRKTNAKSGWSWRTFGLLCARTETAFWTTFWLVFLGWNLLNTTPLAVLICTCLPVFSGAWGWLTTGSQEHHHDEAALLASQRRITPKYLRELVEGIPSTQALRTLKTHKQTMTKKVGKK